MDKTRRNELKATYKESCPRAGVIKVTNTENGKVLIAGHTDVDARINRFRFELAFGGCKFTDLNREWREFGPDAFTFEVIDLVGKPEKLEAAKLQREVETLEALYLDQYRPWGERGYNKPPKTN